MFYQLGENNIFNLVLYSSRKVYSFENIFSLWLVPASVWDRLNAFAQTVGWDFIMDLNALHRHPDGSWDLTNAAELLQYSSARNYSIAGFELGNGIFIIFFCYLQLG